MRILHCFTWNLKDIEENLFDIKVAGFDAIQITPVQDFKDSLTDPLVRSENYWKIYQPINFGIGNIFGSKQDLIDLCEAAEKLDVKIIADVVINHVAGADDGSIKCHNSVADEIKDNPCIWKLQRNIDDWNDRYEQIYFSNGLPSLDLSKEYIQDIIINFMIELTRCGVKGFRIDACKHIALPHEGSNFFERLEEVREESEHELIMYGEIIFPSHELIRNYGMYIDILCNNCNEIRSYNQDDYIVFEESHDTYLTKGGMGYTRQTPTHEINNKHRELNKNFRNTLFYSRPLDNSWKHINK